MIVVPVLLPVYVVAVNPDAVTGGEATVNAVISEMVAFSNRTAGVVQLDQSTVRYAPGDDPGNAGFIAAVTAYLAAPPPLG